MNEINDLMTIHCDAYTLPESPLLSKTARTLLRQQAKYQHNAATSAPPNNLENNDPRETERQIFYSSEEYHQLRARYDVQIETTTLAGVVVEIFSPAEGIPEEHRDTVLVNFHGGSFQTGSRTASHSESIPVAALSKRKVISVDYRMYPEHHYPAATEDAIAVYRALLKDYAPEKIAWFGSSAGAQLVAQLVARVQKEQAPMPAAIALLAEGATQHNLGDSIAMAGSIFTVKYGTELADVLAMPYFDHADQHDPQLCPALSDDLMAAFPPTLLASSTRDLWLSPVVATHRQLHRLGVETELHIWEGLEHCFHYDSELPESVELHGCVVAYFERYLT